jgi:hypothetical protein
LGSTCTKDEINQYVQLFKEFYDIFAWTYVDIKEYDKSIIQHIIPLKEGTKPIRQKPRIINPKLNPLVKLDLEKIERAGIIYFFKHSYWISNPMVVRKKNREI